VVEAKDIIPILVIGGLVLLSRRRAEEVPPPPPEEKPPLPGPPWPYPPILELPPEVEEAMKPITPEVERLAEATRERLEEIKRIIEEIQRVVEERRREAEEFMLLAQAPPPPPTVTEYPTVEIPAVFEPRVPRPPGIRLSNSNLVVEDPAYIGRFITACVTWFCTNFIVRSVPHIEPLEPQALRYARETGNRIVIRVDGVYQGEIPV
jgi:hypothetical protein